MSRWGDEFYGTLKEKVDSGADRLQDVLKSATWLSGPRATPCASFSAPPRQVPEASREWRRREPSSAESKETPRCCGTAAGR